MVAVNRRIRNFYAEQWETLWLEATRLSSRERRRLEQIAEDERDRKLAAKIEALAGAGQAKRAARAAAAKDPPVTDPGREDDLRALFPKAPPRAPRQADGPRVGRELPPEWTTQQACARVRLMEAEVANTIRSPNRLANPGPMRTRAEHLGNLKHSEDGVERMATLIVRLAIGRDSRRLLSRHTRSERSLLLRSRMAACGLSSCIVSTGGSGSGRLPRLPKLRRWLRPGSTSWGSGRGMAVLRPTTPQLR